jgi:CRP-like cAMP-binding protein
MNPLNRIRIFAGLPDAALDRLAHGAVEVDAHHDQEIFAQDDPADALYAIFGGEGTVRMGAIDRRSKRLMVEVFKVEDVFGEIGVIDGGPRTASAVVEGRVRLMRIGGPVFLAVLRDTPRLGVNVAQMFAHRLRRTFDLFKDATFETVEVRLARQLLYLASLGGRKTEAGLVLKSRLKQPDLADLLGTTTRSIISVLNTWRGADIVRYDTITAQLTIHNEDALRALFEA